MSDKFAISKYLSNRLCIEVTKVQREFKIKFKLFSRGALRGVVLIVSPIIFSINSTFIHMC